MSKEKAGRKTSRGFDGLAELKPVLQEKQTQQAGAEAHVAAVTEGLDSLADSAAFERALATYAADRVNKHSHNTALLASSFTIDTRDKERFFDAAERLEKRLEQAGMIGTAVEAPQENKMTEEQLLAGLRGEVPTPARQEAEVAMSKYFDRLQSGTETPAQIHDAVVANLSQEAYMEFRHILDVYERQEEIGAIEKKSPAVNIEQQPEKADDKAKEKRETNEAVKAPSVELQRVGKTLKEMRQAFGEPAGKVGNFSYWVDPSDGRAVILTRGPVEVRRHDKWGEGGFGKIDGVYYEYRDGVFKKMTKDEALAREKAMREAPQKPKPRREKTKASESTKKAESQPEVRTEAPAQPPDNSHKFKRAFDKLDELRRTGVARADQIAFASRGLSDAEFTEFEQLVKARDKERDDQKKAEKAAAKAAQSESATEKAEKAESEEDDVERKEARSLKDMYRIFNKIHKGPKDVGRAFGAAIDGQSLQQARKFQKELEEDGYPHGILEGVMRELEQRHKKEKKEKTEKKREKKEDFEKGLQKELDEMMERGNTARETRPERGDSADTDFERQLQAELAAMMAKP